MEVAKIPLRELGTAKKLKAAPGSLSLTSLVPEPEPELEPETPAFPEAFVFPSKKCLTRPVHIFWLARPASDKNHYDSSLFSYNITSNIKSNIFFIIFS